MAFSHLYSYTQDLISSSGITEWIRTAKETHFIQASKEAKVLVVTSAVVGLGLARWLWRPRNLPPGPLGLPLVGSLFQISDNAHLDYMEMGKKYGDVFSYYIGNCLVIVLNSDEAIRQAFVRQGDDFSDRALEGLQTLGFHDEVFAASFSEHFKFAKKTNIQAFKTHVFGTKKVEMSTLKNVDIAIERILKFKGVAVDPQDLFVKVTTNVMYNLFYSEEFDFDDPKLDEFLHAAREYQRSFIDDTFLGFLLPMLLPRWLVNKLLFRTRQRMTGRVNHFVDLALGKIRDHKKALDVNNPQDYVDSILTARPDADEVALARTISVSMPDGTDTVANVVMYFIYFMCKYPDEQTKLQKLVDTVCGEKPPSLQMREKLGYLEAFIWEALRIIHFVPVLQPHRPTRDTSLLGYHIPQHATVWANVYSVYTDPKIFPQPDKFDPTRFINEDGKLVRTALSYPFGIGRRMCMGEQLVKAEVFLIATSLLQKVTFKVPADEPLPDIKPTNAFVTVPPSFKICAFER